MKIQTEEIVVQEAIEKTGFGKFNLKVSTIGALIYANVTICLLNIGYILPAAVCDFEMTTIDKGRIAIASVLGTCFGSLFWGFLADLKGRRKSLIIALLLQSNVDILISISSNYWAFLTLKIISGFAVIGQVTPLFPYVGEFQPERHRKKILACLSFVTVIGRILLPLLAWAIIPLDFGYRNQFFFFRSWNLFIFVCALLGEILGIWLIFLPESPKYLAETGQNEKLMTVLTRMFQENIGGPAEEYTATLLNSGNVSLTELVSRSLRKSVPDEEISKKKKLRKILNDFKLQGKNTIKAPYLKRLIALSISMFCVASSCYSLLTWFPEILQRFAVFESSHPDETTNVCSISRISPSNSTKVNISQVTGCVQTINTSVYRNSLFLGLAAIFPNLLYLLLVDRLGFRTFAGSYLGLGFASTVGLLFTNTFTQNMILSCIFQSVIGVGLSLLYSLNVVLFPTNTRVFASSVSIFCGRLGTIFGNALFAYLIDDYCTILIGSVAFQMLLAAGLSLTLRA